MSDAEFTELYKSYFYYCLKIVRSYLSKTEDVEDTLAEIFANLWQIRQQIDREQNIKSLVFLITKRKIYDQLRHKYKLKESEVEIEDTPLVELEENNSTESKLISRLVSHLNEKDLQFYQLKYKQNLTIREIASVLKTTENNVKVINNRLIKKLKSIWEKQKNI